jgi:heme A synthase
MAPLIYALCALTASVCAWLLLRAYNRTRYKLLLWGGLCFIGLTLNNGLLVVDKLLLPDINLFTLRLTVALIALLVLLYGIIWDAD